MGMSNKQSITGTNSGELTEFFVAMSIIAKQTNSNLKDVFASMSVSDNSVSGSHKGISYYGDGKMVPSYKEMEHHLAGKTSKTVNEYVSRSQDFANSYTFPEIDEVRNIGGSSGKDDVRLLSKGERVKGLSLKWGHAGIERSQGPSWASTNSLYSRFANIDHLEKEYEKEKEIFTQPEYRFSREKGDYSEALANNGLKMIKTVSFLEKNVADAFVNKTINPRVTAQGYINSFTGAESDVVLVELKSGDILEVGDNAVEELAQKIEEGTFTYSQETSSSGKTLDTKILLNGEDFISFRTTMSTDGVANPDLAKGEVNHLRRVKRQTYLVLNHDIINSYVPGQQPVKKPVTKKPSAPKLALSNNKQPTRKSSPCRAKNPAKCKYHGTNASTALKNNDINSYLSAKGL